jgi:anaerobic ribonucleoside-triphosphate reductase
MRIIKRNGKEVIFEKAKIINAISKANAEIHSDNLKLTDDEILAVADNVTKYCESMSRAMGVEEIQDLVENELMKTGKHEVARKYITYRYEHSMKRQANTTDGQILSLIECENEEVKQENSNKNPTVVSVQRDYMAGEVSKDITRRFLLPKDVIEAHDAGIIHFHDMDYFAQHSSNCCLVNLDDMLQNGTVISETLIEKPHSFATACNIATQIIAQVASSQYGGQSITLSHLAPFVDISRQKHRQDVRKELETAGILATDTHVNKIAELRVRDEIKRGIQTIQYQVITLMTTNGQAPFITVFMYLNEVPEGQLRDDLAIMIEETLRQRTKGVKNEKGVWIAPAFPKLIYVLQEDNVTPDSKYFYLTELAAKCTAKRLVPDYISEKIMLENKGDVFPPMGCRSFVVYDGGLPNIAKAKNYNPNKHKYYGHFNQGVVTINLPDVALSSNKDLDKFWQILEERLELCHKALRCRHERLLGTPSDVAPILWQNGALARLEKGEVIDPLLFGSYSTISLGYAGIYEMTKYMTGESHTSDKGREFAISVMQKLNDKVDAWKAAENIGYGIYSTPLESTVYKFAKSLRNRFGIIEGITDRNYITNSYHVHVTENIDAFSKLSFEAPFQKLALSGCISYVEVPNMKNNIEAIISLLQHIYNTTMYAELNTKSDYCQCCGFDGEIQIVDDNGKLVWECPNCGNRDQNKLNVARRTCGSCN